MQNANATLYNINNFSEMKCKTFCKWLVNFFSSRMLCMGYSCCKVQLVLSPRESRKGKTGERETTGERQDMTNVNNGLPCQVIDSKLLRYQCISQIFGREGNSHSENIYITSKSKYHIVRKTWSLLGNEASLQAQKKKISLHCQIWWRKHERNVETDMRDFL